MGDEIPGAEVAGEDQPNAFDEEEDLEPGQINPTLADARRHAQVLRSNGNRYTDDTRNWAFELLRTCGSKALEITRRSIFLPPVNYDGKNKQSSL
jgi:hypothetical protein